MNLPKVEIPSSGSSASDVKKIMTRHVNVISPDATLQDAASQMDNDDVGALPVCDGESLLGIITDRDIVIRSISAGHDPTMARVRDAMTTPVQYCFEDQSVAEVAKLMQDQQIRRMVVLNRDKRLVGILSLGDLALDASTKLAGEVMEKVVEAGNEHGASRYRLASRRFSEKLPTFLAFMSGIIFGGLVGYMSSDMSREEFSVRKIRDRFSKAA